MDGHGEGRLRLVATGEETRDGGLLNVVALAAKTGHPVAEVLGDRLNVCVLQNKTLIYIIRHGTWKGEGIVGACSDQAQPIAESVHNH